MSPGSCSRHGAVPGAHDYREIEWRESGRCLSVGSKLEFKVLNFTVFCLDLHVRYLEEAELASIGLRPVPEAMLMDLRERLFDAIASSPAPLLTSWDDLVETTSIREREVFEDCGIRRLKHLRYLTLKQVKDLNLRPVQQAMAKELHHRLHTAKEKAGSGSVLVTSFDDFEEVLGSNKKDAQIVRDLGIAKLPHIRFMSENQINKLGLGIISKAMMVHPLTRPYSWPTPITTPAT